MNGRSRRELEERLAPPVEATPPAELLEFLRREIPEELPTAGERPEARREARAPRWRWQLAASLAALAGLGLLVAHLAREVPLPGAAPEERAAVSPKPASNEDAAKRQERQERREPAAVSSDQAPAGAESGPERVGEAQAPAHRVAAPPESGEPSRLAASETEPGPAAPGKPGELAERRAEISSELKAVAAPQPPAEEKKLAAKVAVPRAEERRLASGDLALSLPERPASESGLPSPAAPSTGGTAEPNDQPYGDVFFRAYGTNPFVDTEDDPLSTFGLDVDTGSYTVVRRYLADGHRPPPEAVRVEELLNAFDYGDPPPRDGADFAVSAEGAPSLFAPGPRYYWLRFHLAARRISEVERRPAVLTFVVDVSGSMAREDRLGLVRRSLEMLLGRLRPGDRVGLVVYGDRGRVLLEPTGDREAVREALEHLEPGGSTNAEEGLVLGYGLAERYFEEGATNRVVLCSDGVANVGRTGPGSILRRIGEAAHRGIELTALGFGMGNYNDVLLEQLADRGDGRYAYIDNLEEARRVLVETLTGTLETVARDARVQVELEPSAVARYRLVGYENRDLPDPRFRDDTADAGEVGAGQGVTALYQVKLREGVPPGALLATLHLRYRSTATGEVVEISHEVRRRDLAGSWEAAPAALRLTSLVAELGEVLKGSYWAKQVDLDEVFRRAQRVVAEDYPGDPRKAELVSLIGRAASLVRQ